MREGWKVSRLGDVILPSGTIDPTKSPARKFQYVDVSGVSNETFKIEQTAEIIGRDAPSRARRQIRSGDVIFATIRPTLKRIAVVPPNLDGEVCSTGYFVFRTKTHLNSKFLFYYLFTDQFMKAMAALQTGASYPAVNDTQVREQKIAFPPLPEQKRIVAILDEAFEGIDTAIANAEKNLANARELFECQVTSIFMNRGLGWEDQKLDQVCIVERGSSPRPIQDYFTTELDGVNWIKIGDTEEGGKYVYKTAQKITPEGAKKSRYVDEGDFILTNSMSFGRPYIMKTSGYIHDGWFVLRLSNSIDPEYFYYLLSSSLVQSQFSQLASGSVVKNISGDLVKRTVLPIPPLAQQQVIVSRLLKVSLATKRLEAVYQQKVSSLKHLKQDILRKAFAGELAAHPVGTVQEAAE